ncbi:MAG: Vitamin K epoxide reductase family protein [Deltaproteobacteria bacterium ADurb.Bin510]|nr:MAG: Vitamin K epoxide reductase family protein [Deltaproteobacteria bacterium ADurb.Bin510]
MSIKRIVFLAFLTLMPLNSFAAGVNLVFFYSPSCSHCHELMGGLLPELQNQYGRQLLILGLNVDEPAKEALMNLALKRFDPSLSAGTPIIMIGDDLLQGRTEIVTRLPGLIDSYLKTGGADWPDLPGLSKFTAAPQAPPKPAEPTLKERFMRDKLGNSLAVVVLVLLHLALIAALWPQPWLERLFLPDGVALGLAALGLVIAGYLAWVELTNTAAICGPVGDCNAVQSSEYALLFGFLPVGLLGVMGYAAIMATLAGSMLAGASWRRRFNQACFLLCLFGLGFSIYLTFLEPFVIGATCAWCLTSAVIMAVLTLLSSARLRQSSTLSRGA